MNRSKLLAISGRSRKIQIALAAEKGIFDYPCPAGGCLLTDKNFAERMSDYFDHTEHPSIKDIPLLKVGRHFRLATGDKVIVAHNEAECRKLKSLCGYWDHLLVPIDFTGPTVLLQGGALPDAIEKMLHYTKRAVPARARVLHEYKGGRKMVYVSQTRCPLPDVSFTALPLEGS